MEKPLVSICIPTFNRSSQLEKTLKSIVVQPEFKTGKVEVVISDNASTDNTEEVSRKYADEYKNIRYFRNRQNVMDENFPLALSRATGLLRKLNNDTIMLTPNALSEICELAQRYSVQKPCIFLVNGKRKRKNDELLSFCEFTVREGYRVTWIGSFTIWDDECENIEQDLAGCELKLWQVRKFYEMAYKKDAVVVCDFNFGLGQPLPQKDISYGLYQVFYQNYMKLLSPYIQNATLQAKDVEKIEKDLLYKFFTNWIVSWEMNNTSYQYSESENLKAYVFKQYENKPYWRNYLKYYQIKLIRKKIKQLIKRIINRT